MVLGYCASCLQLRLKVVRAVDYITGADMTTSAFKVLKTFSLGGRDVSPAAAGKAPVLVELTDRQAVQCLQMGLVARLPAPEAEPEPMPEPMPELAAKSATQALPVPAKPTKTRKR